MLGTRLSAVAAIVFWMSSRNGTTFVVALVSTRRPG
jgi:hypothetical protein